MPAVCRSAQWPTLRDDNLIYPNVGQPTVAAVCEVGTRLRLSFVAPSDDRPYSVLVGAASSRDVFRPLLYVIAAGSRSHIE